MSKCPYCGSDGADILLQKVFCPNIECQWYDEVVYNRLVDLAIEDIDELLSQYLDDTDTLSDPDKTPVWHPSLPFDD